MILKKIKKLTVLAFSVMFFPLFVCSSNLDGFKTPSFFDGTFHDDTHRNHLLDALKIGWATKTNCAAYCDSQEQIDSWIVVEKPVMRSIKPVITWIGHATALIQINNINLITDPVFFGLGLFDGLIGYPRQTPPGIALEDLPPIDLVIISHDHHDHLNRKSIEFIQKKFNPRFVVPLKFSSWLNDCGCENVIEVGWGDNTIFERFDAQTHTKFECKITFLPAIHWCNRGLFGSNARLWGSWLIESNSFKIYFGGDSAYGKHYKDIAKQFPGIDVALLPVGPNEPRHLMKHSHMSTEESVAAFDDLGATMYIPIHWGTFRLGTDTFDGPIKRLKACWQDYIKDGFFKDKILKLAKFGEAIKFDPIDKSSL